eukprot:TRINITY_DN66615_c0_g1_i1.p1 TRINITY_DN66615_c0_g1~~TRINITY_DN66615_c0_g1_i1.p1  ORF type:complete len:553 (+),score=85.47 TRINITY_DN66615_c0_g1_i1:162-1820(+)
MEWTKSLTSTVTSFTYPTPKVVRLHDWKLGLLRYFVLTGIFLFITVDQIAYKGNHLKMVSVTGRNQVNFHAPTVGNCDSFLGSCEVDYRALNRLDYCKQGNATGIYQKVCVYRDPTELGDASRLKETIMPTNIRTYVQRRKCFPDAKTNYECPNGIFEYLGPDGKAQPGMKPGRPWSDLFVADVERFRIQLDHSAISDLGVNSNSFQMAGVWKNCSGFMVGEERDDCPSEPILCAGGNNSCTKDQEHYKKSLQLLKKAAPVASVKALDRAVKSDKKKEEEDDIKKLPVAPKTPKVKFVSMLSVEEKLKTKKVKKTSAKENKGDSHPSFFGKLFDFGGQPETDKDQYEEGSQLEFDEAEQDYVQSAMENNLAVSTKSGDIFPMSLLLKMAGVDLDKPSFNSTQSYRATGFSLLIRVHYTNIRPWVGLAVNPWTLDPSTTMHYSIEALQHSGETLTRRVIREEDKNFVTGRLLGKRVVEEDRGISIVVQQYGDMKIWDPTSFLVILTTSLALLALSYCIMDAIALNCMERSEEFAKLKYDCGRYDPDLEKARSA